MAGNSRVVEVVTLGTTTLQDGTPKKTYNVFRYLRASDTPTFDKSALNTAFQAGPLAAMLAALSSAYTANSVAIRALDDAMDAETFFSAAGSGAISGDSLPPDKCVCINTNAGLRGRFTRGRKFFSPVAESDTLKDEINGATPISRWTALRDAILSDLTVSGITLSPIVLSRFVLGSGTTIAEYVAASFLQVDGDVNLNLARLKRRAQTETVHA